MSHARSCQTFLLHMCQEALRQLWAKGFPDEPCTSLRTARWKDMGWQVRGACTRCRSNLIRGGVGSNYAGLGLQSRVGLG